MDWKKGQSSGIKMICGSNTFYFIFYKLWHAFVEPSSAVILLKNRWFGPFFLVEQLKLSLTEKVCKNYILSSAADSELLFALDLQFEHMNVLSSKPQISNSIDGFFKFYLPMCFNTLKSKC